MKISVIHFLTYAKPALLAVCACALSTAAASAQEDVTDSTPSVGDVAMTPISDLNLRKDPIPAVLLHARQDPYRNANVSTCFDVRREVGDLDAVLGDDFDTAAPDQREMTPTGVAQTVIGFFIPFRGIIREVSGANSHEYHFREAIAAGLMRRAYLKGKGEEMGCRYPAAPASEALIARLQAADTQSDENGEVVATAEDGTRFVSRPVVQEIEK